ncbi:hypothetical protein C8A05DRAFT_36504, partial [Staphylotrichum tortipilum]
MAAPTVYEGGSGQHRGMLFDKLKFWVSLRVPSRDQYLAKIKDNGGTVVRMEQQADVLVADHLRKRDAPDGSVSYKYIDACVANGALVEMDEHRIFQTGGARPAGSSRRAKGTRTPFTESDKRILVTWVRKCEAAGESINGNVIYQTLAEHYPSHTWHSWRAKWIELSKLPNEFLPAELPEMPPPTAQPAIPPPARVSAPPPSSVAAQPTASPSATNRPIGQGISRLQELAERKTKIQLAETKRTLELDEKKKKIELARSLQPLSRGYLVRKRVQSYRAREPLTRFQARAQGFLTRSALGLPSGDIPRETEDTQWFSARERAQTQADPLRLEGDEVEGFDGEDAQLEWGMPNGPGEGDAVSDASELGDVKAGPTAKPAASQQITPSLKKDEFWLHFNDFNEVNDLPSLPWVQIGHRAIDLWDLWRFSTQEPHHPSRNWDIVAEGLGIDWVEEPDVPGLLKAAYEKFLLEFEKFLLEFENLRGIDEGGDDDDEEGEEEEGEEEEGEEEEDEEGVEDEEDEEDEMDGKVEEQDDEEQAAELGESSSLGNQVEEATEASDDEETVSNTKFASSPPVIGFKRARRSSPTYLGSVRKRPRLDLSSEVPYTPDTPRFRAPEDTLNEPDTASLQDAQLDGAHDVEQLTPSQQLLFELEMVSPTQEPSQTLPRRFPSADRPLPSVERTTEARDSDSDSDSESRASVV